MFVPVTVNPPLNKGPSKHLHTTEKQNACFWTVPASHETKWREKQRKKETPWNTVYISICIYIMEIEGTSANIMNIKSMSFKVQNHCMKTACMLTNLLPSIWPCFWIIVWNRGLQHASTNLNFKTKKTHKSTFFGRTNGPKALYSIWLCHANQL